jgi:peptidoglycan glycosyltransferase
MHQALVHSCNAYFAQLAVRLGPQLLLGTASRFRIALTADADSTRQVRQSLPQIGYGQAQIVASPLRMASVAGAIAADGMLRAPHIDQARVDSRSESVLDPSAARRLGGYMRDVVLGGTGRGLRDHVWPIAGKTGTAEVTGRPSHAWFVGVSPYGSAKKQIAFAIVIENAGYGGAIAAPAAGEIVSAAAAAGLIGK